MPREPKILSTRAPIIRLWRSFDAGELTAQKTGFKEDLCPLPDTEKHPYRSRLKEHAQKSERDFVLVFDSEGLSASQCRQMQELTDSSIGLYVVDYQELRVLSDERETLIF
ncbi:hypothetical protein RLOatenuis_3580 [Rickettsiales bacterium]|nr:hypothetical protein RLOatenuis_3580 [Rickettsiales bacterium]